MDWFTWLSRTSLDPSLVYQYSLTFAQNELEKDDIPYFNHEFLQSMGISTAKHRLEILKLARKERDRTVHPIVWFMFAINKTKVFLAKRIETLFHRKNPGLSLGPKRNHSLRWKVSMLQRNKRLIRTEWPRLGYESPRFESGQKMLMLMDRNPGPGSRTSDSTQSSSPVELKGSGGDDSSFQVDGEYWSSSMEEIKWDSMFHNLKPT